MSKRIYKIKILCFYNDPILTLKKQFCKEAVKNLNARCVNYCYPVRLRKTFEYAKEHGYDTVTTTLLYSIYQKHDFIKKLMEQYSEEYGIDFV